MKTLSSRVRYSIVGLLAAVTAVLAVIVATNSQEPAKPGLNPPVAQASELGVSDNLAHLPDHVRDEQLRKLQQSGVKWLRKDIEWRGAERQQRQYNWSVNDSTVAAVSRFGIKPLLILSYAPAWAAGPNQPDCLKVRCSPADAADAISAFGTFAGQTAAHYCAAPYNVQAIEIWNEPNLSKYWFNPNPALYVKMLKAAHSAIRATGCNITVLLGGLGDRVCVGCYTSADFLTEVYKNGGGGFFDAIGCHPYITGPPNSQTWQPSSLHDIMAKNGDGHKKVWATEFAYSSRIGADKQAQYMQAAIKTYRNYTWAGPLFWFTLQDKPDAEGFGLIDHSGSPKPAFGTFGELARTG